MTLYYKNRGSSFGRHGTLNLTVKLNVQCRLTASQIVRSLLTILPNTSRMFVVPLLTVIVTMNLKIYFFRKKATFVAPLINKAIFSVKLLNVLLNKMKNGKAAGLDHLTCEHLKYSYPIVTTILCKLFNLIFLNSHVPVSFAKSYMVPIPKGNTSRPNKTLTVNDFWGISISL